MLGGVGLAGAEQHRECRHRQRHDQRDVADDRNRGDGLVLAEDGLERRRHGLELERDIGNRSDDRDQRDGGGNRLALAVTRGDEIGDRGDVLRFRELDHAAQQRRAERDHQHRADIDREKIHAGAGGETDRTEERPGRAVDRQRQRIDQPAGAAALGRREPVAVAGHEKQEPDVAEGGCDHAPVVQHRCSLPCGFGERLHRRHRKRQPSQGSSITGLGRQRTGARQLNPGSCCDGGYDVFQRKPVPHSMRGGCRFA